MELEGHIVLIGETETFGESGFRKRLLLIQTDEQYSQKIPVDFVQDKCDILNSYSVGGKVKISINIRGSEWTNPQGETKYFSSIQAWKINKGGSQSSNVPPVPPAEAFEPADDLNEEEEGDLPF